MASGFRTTTLGLISASGCDVVRSGEEIALGNGFVMQEVLITAFGGATRLMPHVCLAKRKAGGVRPLTRNGLALGIIGKDRDVLADVSPVGHGCID